MLRKTKIVCTIGPGCESEETLALMVENGMDVARLNFSHGNHEEHLRRIRDLREVYSQSEQPGAILLDTKGPEIRLGRIADGAADLTQGQEFVLTTEEVMGNQKRATVSHSDFTADVSPEDRILLDDGLIELTVNEVTGTEVKTVVKNSGTIKDRKSVSVPGASLSLPSMTDKDREDILLGVEQDVEFIAASFVRKAQDVLEIRKFLEEHDSDIPIISKVENQEGVDNLLDILEVSDGLMVARGDLGVDILTEEVPLVQKRMITECNLVGKPVITATQMLESMTDNPRPTRAEASDVANAIFDGTDAVMLSGETAVGKYPVEAIQTMARIAKSSEQQLKKARSEQDWDSETSVTEAIGFSTFQIANKLNADAIVTATESGYTARMVAKFRPRTPVVAVTPREQVLRRLCLSWGVYPVKSDEPEDATADEMFRESIRVSVDSGYVNQGDLIVITAGVPVGVSGTTNLIRVHTVGEIILSGAGIGKRPVTGEVVRVGNAGDANKITDGAVVVVQESTKDIVSGLHRAAGLIAEEEGYTSPSAIVGLELGLPVIVGAENALELLEEGEEVTIDPLRGLVYRGEATIL